MKSNIYKLKYRSGETPAGLFDILENADDTDLKILVALMMSADADGAVDLDGDHPWVSSVDRGELTASLKFWTGAGVISRASSRGTAKKTETAAVKSAPATAEGTAHRGGAVERVTEIAAYKTSELAKLMEDRRVSAEYLDAAQRILGKTFTTYETGVMAGLIDQLELEEEAVLAVVSYCARLGKKSVKFIEKTIFSFYDEDITSAAAINQRIGDIERANETTYKIKSLFGAADRELSAKEKKLFRKWTLELGYGIDVIKLAYDVTIDTIHEPAPSYVGGVLENWSSEGLKTAEEVEKYLEEKKAKRAEVRSFGDTKSFDTDDFFEAAMNRSYEKMKKGGQG